MPVSQAGTAGLLGHFAPFSYMFVVLVALLPQALSHNIYSVTSLSWTTRSHLLVRKACIHFEKNALKCIEIILEKKKLPLRCNMRFARKHEASKVPISIHANFHAN